MAKGGESVMVNEKDKFVDDKASIVAAAKLVASLIHPSPNDRFIYPISAPAPAPDVAVHSNIEHINSTTIK